MPMPPENLKRTLIPRVLTPVTTVAELLYLFAEQPEPQRYYAVVRVAADAYDVLALEDLQEPAARRGPALLPLALGGVAGLLRPAEPLYQARIGQATAERAMHATPRRRAAVLDEAGEVIGVLAAVFMAGAKGPSPLDLLDTLTPAVLGGPEAAPAAPHISTPASTASRPTRPWSSGGTSR